MVKIKNQIYDVLNRLYLVDLGNNKKNNIGIEAAYQLDKLDTDIRRVYAKTDNNLPYNWIQENCLVLKIGNLAFSYYLTDIDGEKCVVVDEVAERQGNTYQIVNENLKDNYINKKRLYESIMRDVSKIIKIHLKRL